VWPYSCFPPLSSTTVNSACSSSTTAASASASASRGGGGGGGHGEGGGGGELNGDGVGTGIGEEDGGRGRPNMWDAVSDFGWLRNGVVSPHWRKGDAVKMEDVLLFGSMDGCMVGSGVDGSGVDGGVLGEMIRAVLA
jgi:hypothetical protein